MVDAAKFIATIEANRDTYEAASRTIFAKEDKVQGWCPTPLMWLLNTAVSCLEKDEEYLEIGSFCGRSLAAALKDNAAKATVIDPLNLWTQNGTTYDIWHSTVANHNLTGRVALYQQFAESCGDALPKIGVFFYDGNHDSGHTYEGLCKYKPFLAKSAIIVVDDYEIFGGDQQSVFSGHKLDINRPVGTDTDRWIAENRDHVKWTMVTPWLHGQMIICYET